jgi:hypothetical protein
MKSNQVSTKKLKSFVTFPSFPPSTRHKTMQIIPNIWIDYYIIIILQPDNLNSKKQQVMKPRTIFGIVLIVAGLWKLANMWGIVENDWLWSQPWTAYIVPVLLIYVGVSTIINSYRKDPDQWLQRPVPINEDGKRIVCCVHYGGDEYVFRGEPFHGARLDAFCGGIRMDLREAVITEDEEIDIHTFCGGIELFVPTTVNVVVKSRNFIGGVGNHATHVVGSEAPCLHIVADNFIGGVDIKN